METQSLLATIARLKAQLADQEVELNDIKQERDDYREDLSRNRTKAAKLTSLAEAQASQLRDLERKLERFRREADSDVPRVKQACDIGGTGITRGPAKEDSNIQVERVETTTSLEYMDGARNDTSDGASMLASAAPNDFASSIEMAHGRQEHTVMSKRRVSDTETHPFDDRQTKRVKAERSQSPDIALSLLQTFRPPTAPYGDGRVPYLDAHTGSSVHSLLREPTVSATPSELSGSVHRPAQVFGAHTSNSPLLSSANKATAMLGNRPMFFVSSSSSLPRDATADDITAAIAAAKYTGQGRYSRTGHQQAVSDDKPQKTSQHNNSGPPIQHPTKRAGRSATSIHNPASKKHPCCLICGEHGHKPCDCVRSADRFAAWRDGVVVVATTGASICYNFNLQKRCTYKKCQHEHLCSLCGDPKHGCYSRACSW